MKQLVCSPRGGELVKAVLSGEASLDVLPPAVRDFLSGSSSGLSTSEGCQFGVGSDPVHTMYLLPTLDCQLRCDYCRITRMQGLQAGFRLSPQSACESIDRFFGKEPDGVRRTAVFFGGEPLLVSETLFAAIRRLRAGPGKDNTDIVLQTNAIAIDDQTAEFLAAHDVFVLASIDGPPEVHDRHRKFPDGVGSYERTAAGYHSAKRHGCRVGISATLTGETGDRFLSAFPAFLDDLRPDEFGIGTHLHPLSSGRSPHQASPTMAARVLTEAFVLARQRGLYFQQMCQRIGPFVNGTRRGGCAYDSQVLLGDAQKFDPWLRETNIEVVRWLMHDLLSHVQDRVRGQDFHVVTPQERALLLGSIALEGRNVPMPRVVRYGETEAEKCPAE